MIADFLAGLALLLAIVTGGYVEPEFGAFSDPFLSVQLAASPSNGLVLKTDGTSNYWDTDATGGGGGSGVGTVSTSSLETIGQLAYWTTSSAYPAKLSSLATTTLTATSPLTLSNPVAKVGGTNSVLTISTTTTSLFSGTGGNILAYFNGLGYLPVATSSINVGTASALFANGSNCSSGSFPLGVDASGAVETCTDAWTEAENTAANYEQNLTAGDALTRTGDDFDFDGGATPAGDLGGTWASPSVTDDSHAHTSTTISGLDVSADLNLTGGAGLTLTNDDMACDTGSGTVFGCITAADWTTFNNKWDLASSTIPIAKGGTGLTAVGASSTVLTTNGTIMIWQSIVSYVESIISAASLVLTGNWDFGGATGLEIPNGTAPTVNATGEQAWDTTSGQQIIYDGTATRVLSNGYLYPAFTYATSTAWTGTTTIPIGTAFVAETWSQVQCFTDTGTLNVAFNDGTNFMQYLNASTTVGTFNVSSNNTFTAAEKRYVNIGTPASSPTKISCTVRKAITAD